MEVNKSQIKAAIQDTIDIIKDHFERHPRQICDDLSPVVYSCKISPRKYYVGWNFEPTGIEIGDVSKFDDGSVSGLESKIEYVELF